MSGLAGLAGGPAALAPALASGLSSGLLAGESAQVTRWPERLLGTVATLAVVVGICLLFLRGWRRRVARDAALPPPLRAPASAPAGESGDEAGDGELGGLLAQAEGSYVVTAHAGDWLDRVAAHGLGIRGEARMAVGWAGVLWERTGAPEVFVPAAALRGVRLERGMAGKFVEEGGLVVVTWQPGEPAGAGGPGGGVAPQLDTGFRPRAAASRDELLAAVQMVMRSVDATPGGGPVVEGR